MANLEKKVAALEEAVQQLYSELRNTPPIGTILLEATDKETPKGYLLCDGGEYDTADYPELFEKIGNRYGGDGVSTFRVPDPRGLFLRFHDKGRGIDPGRDIGSEQEQSTAMPTNFFKVEEDGEHNHDLLGSGEHSHQFDSFHYTPDRGKGGDYWHLLNSPYRGNVHGNGAHTHTINKGGSHIHKLSGGDKETRPGNIAFIGFIKY